MPTLYDSTFESFCYKKNQSSFFLKKNPNLARILSFTLCYQLENYIFLLLTNIEVFAEKGPKCAKIGSKLSVKLTAQISDGFKKINFRENYEL